MYLSLGTNGNTVPSSSLTFFTAFVSRNISSHISVGLVNCDVNLGSLENIAITSGIEYSCLPSLTKFNTLRIDLGIYAGPFSDTVLNGPLSPVYTSTPNPLAKYPSGSLANSFNKPTGFLNNESSPSVDILNCPSSITFNGNDNLNNNCNGIQPLDIAVNRPVSAKPIPVSKPLYSNDGSFMSPKALDVA